MTRDPMNEDRLRAALRAEAATVDPDDDTSLATIRRRGRTAIVRRRAVLGGVLGVVVLGAAAAVVLPQLGDDGNTVIVDPGPDETTTTPPEPTTTVPPTTTTPPTEEAYVWPPSGHEHYTQPLDAARSFVTEFVGVPDPPLGDVVEEEPRRVQVPVYTRGEDGSVRDDITRSTIHLVQASDGTWRVTRALSESIVIDSVQVMQSARAVTVSGRGRGFEGTIIVQVRAEQATPEDLLDEEILIAGSGEELLPFEATLALPRAPALTDSVFAFNDSGFEGAVPDFTVVPAVTTTTERAVDVYFVGPDGTAQAVTRPAASVAVLNAALAALFDGPTPAEQAQGLTTALPAAAPNFHATATINGDVATVDIPIGLAQPDPNQAGQTLPADQAELMVEQLYRTVFQFPNVSQVQFTLSGSCEDFGLWIGRRGTCLFDRALLETGN